MLRSFTAVAVMLGIIFTATAAQAEWWTVNTSSDTTAKVRVVFVERLKEHRHDVEVALARRAHVLQLRRAAQQAARAAAQAQEALDNPQVPPSPTYSSYTGGCLSDTQVAGYLRAAGFPESAISTMLYYSHRESGNCPGAINSSSGACGLFQIYPAQPGCTDPATNARLAYEKYQASGFSPWGG